MSRFASRDCTTGCSGCAEVRTRSRGNRLGWALHTLAAPVTQHQFDRLDIHVQWERRLAARAVADAWPHTAPYRNTTRQPCAKCGARDDCAPRLATPLHLGATPETLDTAPVLCDACHTQEGQQ